MSNLYKAQFILSNESKINKSKIQATDQEDAFHQIYFEQGDKIHLSDDRGCYHVISKANLIEVRIVLDREAENQKIKKTEKLTIEQEDLLALFNKNSTENDIQQK